MLEKPELPDEKIIACLESEYGLPAVRITFLPLGADQNTAVYRVVRAGERPCFLKLRRAVFDETTVAVPKFLSDQGIAQIIAPITTKTGQLWASLDPFVVILYPFIEGRSGFEVKLSNRQWVEFGTALKTIHSAVVPPTLRRHIRQESYSPQWREMVKRFLVDVADNPYDDPVAAKFAAFLAAKEETILDLVGRAERLGLAVQAHSPEFVLCHSDIHAGNLLLDPKGPFYIVDWDEPILAPKERDLVFIGGGVAGVWNQAHEEAWFYRGYGQTKIDSVALTYYRYERIVQDIAAACRQLLLTEEGGDDRELRFRFFTDQFLPNNVIEIASKTEETLLPRFPMSP